jgi:transcriptional antiterminator RfaH
VTDRKDDVVSFGPRPDEGAHRGGRRWYAVVAQPRKEMWAAENLRNQDFEVFVPRLRKSVRRGRVRRMELAPLFPRYLFVSLDLGRERWRSVRGTFGVATMIMEGERPQPAPRGVVEALLEATDPEGTLVPPTAGLKPGDPVRFLAGPFADRIGRLTELDDSGRVKVLLELLGAERHVTGSVDVLAPIRA